jgi:hypothetical protein
MDRLIVKNFSPLKDVDIELNKINLFIGSVLPFYLENAIATSIVSQRALVTDEMGDEFDNLIEIYREFKHAK